MLCDRCKKNQATVFSTVNINGNVIQSHLCEKCAAMEDFNFNSFFSDSPLNFTFDDSFDVDEFKCDNCGYTLNDYLKNGYVGCSNCYKVFKKYIDSALLKIQPNNRHNGKKLEFFDNNNDLNKIKKLEIKLKQAVNEENYELASEIKKQIIKLKEEENENK